MRKFSNFHIILRGKPVEQVSIADELKFIKTITYKPQVGVDGESVSLYFYLSYPYYTLPTPPSGIRLGGCCIMSFLQCCVTLHKCMSGIMCYFV